MSDSAKFNEFIKRTPLKVKAIPGALVTPTLVEVLHHLLDRIEALEKCRK